ncbi:MAG: class I SAM-dependent methyltransferase [bacterium]|nr:class I SAM-dependent methyltransferase [bacterium]
MDKNTKTTIDSYNNNASVYADLRPLVPPVIKQLDFFIENLKGTKILDIGCGPGRDASYFLGKNIAVTGIDLSERLIETAKSNNPSGDFFVMDMRHLDFPDSFFDGLWVNTSFLHLPKTDAGKTLKEFNRVLAPGGVLFLGVQSHRNEKAKVTKNVGPREVLIGTEDFHGDLRFFAYYDEDEIKKLLEKTGFQIIRLDSREEPETKIGWINLFAKKAKLPNPQY